MKKFIEAFIKRGNVRMKCYKKGIKACQRGSWKLKLLLIGAILIGGFMLLPQQAYSAIPQILTYQGKLVSFEGQPLNGTYNMTFNIYNSSSGGSPIWGETHTAVPVTNGRFTVILGETIPVSVEVFDGTDKWLGIKVGGDSEMSPRMRMSDIGYAYQAHNADLLGGVSSTEIGGGGISTAEADLRYL